MIDIAANEIRYIARLRRRAVQILDDELAAHGIGHGTYKYLYALYLEDHVYQQYLANLVGDDKAATTRALGKLEAQNLVQRRTDDEDRRLIRVSLTPAGRALQPVIKAALARAVDAITFGLEPEEAQLFKKLLGKAADALLIPDNASSRQHH